MKVLYLAANLIIVHKVFDHELVIGVAIFLHVLLPNKYHDLIVLGTKISLQGVLEIQQLHYNGKIHFHARRHLVSS